jgi:hypothetical protein
MCVESNWSELFLLFVKDIAGFAKDGFDLLRLGVEVIA